MTEAEATRLVAEGEQSYHDRLYIGTAAVLKSGAAAGGPGSREWKRATEVLVRISEGNLSRSQAEKLLTQAEFSDIADAMLDEETRMVLLRLATEVAIADGNLSQSELDSLKSLATWLRIDPGTVEALVFMIVDLSGASHSTSGPGFGSSDWGGRRSTDGVRSATYVSDHRYACQVLGVASDSSVTEIRVSYRRLMRQYHPDLAQPADRDVANRKAAEINAAYDFLLGKTTSMHR